MCKKIHNDVIEYDTIVTSKSAAFNTYRKIPIIRPGAYFWSKGLFTKFFFGGGGGGEGLIFGGEGLTYGRIFAF